METGVLLPVSGLKNQRDCPVPKGWHSHLADHVYISAKRVGRSTRGTQGKPRLQLSIDGNLSPFRSWTL